MARAKSMSIGFSRASNWAGVVNGVLEYLDAVLAGELPEDGVPVAMLVALKRFYSYVNAGIVYERNGKLDSRTPVMAVVTNRAIAKRVFACMNQSVFDGDISIKIAVYSGVVEKLLSGSFVPDDRSNVEDMRLFLREMLKVGASEAGVSAQSVDDEEDTDAED